MKKEEIKLLQDILEELKKLNAKQVNITVIPPPAQPGYQQPYMPTTPPWLPPTGPYCGPNNGMYLC